MNKKYLQDAQLDDAYVSQVFFRDGNKMDMDLHFGCGVYVFNNKAADLEQLMEFFTQLSSDQDDERWELHRSTFISVSNQIEWSFHDSYIPVSNPISDMMLSMVSESDKERQHQTLKKQFPYIIGKVEKFTPTFHQVKVMKDGEVEGDGTNFLNKAFNRLNGKIEESNIQWVIDIFNRGIPVVSFPNIQRCLGMENKDAVLEIKEGYATIGYDYSVSSSDANCLFNMGESLKDKEVREMKSSLGANDFGFNAKTLSKVGEVINTIKNQAEKSNIGGPNFDLNKVMEGVGAGRDALFEGIKSGKGPEYLKMIKDNE